MRPRRSRSRLPVVLDALTLAEADPATRRLAEALGGEPVAVLERAVGVPVRRSRRLQFASGAEIALHDDAVVAVVLPGGDLADWIPGVGSDATLEDLTKAIGSRARFAGIGTPYFAIDGGFARARFRDDRGWKERGNLVDLTVTVDQPGLALRAEDDDCPTCSDLLVRTAGAPGGEVDGGVDVGATVTALAGALTSGALTQGAHWVRLEDLQPLHASGLMERVESQLGCTTCRRIICLTLLRDAPPTFGFHTLDDARRRPLEAIPPVEQWGDADRVAREQDAMQYVDHEPAVWFLVQQRGVLYLDARYSHSAMIDDSALVRLDDTELEAYRQGGHDYLTSLARRIHDSAPYHADSPYHSRNLFGRPGGKQLREAVGAAVVNHTWLAQQRR